MMTLNNLQNILKRIGEMKCELCPRRCSVNRAINHGYCKQGLEAKVANYSLHFGEEPCISYEKGSGTVFFSGCSLRCVYCQNYDISNKNIGQVISLNQLAEIFKELDENADNINLVTPTHFSNVIQEAFKLYKPKNPVIYNTHGYELESEIEKIANFTDIFLTDFKYYSPEISKKYSSAENYFEIASKALNKMLELKPNIYENGKILQGVIVRHLLLPNNLEDSKKVLKYLSEKHPNITISLMAQYTPYGEIKNFPELNRKITTEEYDELTDYAYSLGLDGYMQELSSADEEFIPEFSDILKPLKK